MTETSKKILICEDEKPMARALELKLNHVGFTARAVHNGEECLAALAEESFDLILLDLMMPKIDGFKVLEELKARNITTPVIVTSNLGQAEDVKRAKELGARDFLIKSNVPLAAIVEKIKQMLDA